MTKQRLFTILICLIFLVGLSLLLYPLFSNLWNSYRQARLVDDYAQEVSQSAGEDYSQWFAEAEVYNQSLIGQDVPSVFAFITEEEDEAYLKLLSFREDGVMGYLSIPKISVRLPIYHSTTSQALEKGVGHLQGSSLPIGGESTHAVLSAHRGLPSSTLFTDLDLLEIGDRFYIYILDRTLAYEVDQILIIEPYETDALAITPGEDYVTLMTCTPYGVNTHRLLVRGHRVEYTQALAEQDEAEPTVSSIHTRYGLWAGGGAAVTAVFIAALYAISRNRRPHRRGKPGKYLRRKKKR